jgi:hypothetical protein
MNWKRPSPALRKNQMQRLPSIQKQLRINEGGWTEWTWSCQEAAGRTPGQRCFKNRKAGLPSPASLTHLRTALKSQSVRRHTYAFAPLTRHQLNRTPVPSQSPVLVTSGSGVLRLNQGCFPPKHYLGVQRSVGAQSGGNRQNHGRPESFKRDRPARSPRGRTP